MRAPLTVRIDDGYTDRQVTAHVTGFGFRKVAPGGYHSLQMRLNLPYDFFRDLGPADRVTVYDARTGAVVIEGLTENPGGSSGPGGQSYDLSAMGTMILAQDESRALIYVDKDLQGWFRDVAGSTAVNAGAEVSSDPMAVAEDGMLCRLPYGQPITTGSAARMAYHRLLEAGMQLGGLQLTTKSGKTVGGFLNVLVWSPPSGAEPVQSASDIRTTPISNTRWAGGGGPYDPPAGAVTFALALRRTGGATNVADDDTWSFFYDIAVLGRRKNRYGVDLTGSAEHGGAASWVRADWVVEDILGRVLTMCDPNAAVIEAGSYEIDQLAYPDKATAQRVLDDLALFEPNFLWELGETLPSGKVRFRYRKWPTTARYEISTARDDYRAPGGEVALANRIAVFWTDRSGATQTKIVTRSVPELGGAPGDPGARIKDAESITLPPGKSSERNAFQAGYEDLAAKADPATSATVVIRRRLHDHLTGRDVLPHELEPGYLASVLETGEILRVTEMAYDDDAGTATLTLGEPVLTQEQRIARLKAAVALVGSS